MMNIINGITSMYADAYTQTAGWITAHPVMTVISLAAGLAVTVVSIVVTFKSLSKLF